MTASVDVATIITKAFNELVDGYLFTYTSTKGSRKKKIKFAQKKKRTDYKITFKFYSWNAA